MKFVFNDNRNIFEGMTKEEILAAIVQAVEGHEISNVDTGFVTTLKEMNSGNGIRLWVGTTAQYNALPVKISNCVYLLTDDTEFDDLETAIQQLQAQMAVISGMKNMILLNQEVAFGATGGIDLLGDIPIINFSLASVEIIYNAIKHEILCSVTKQPSGGVRLLGTAVIPAANYTQINVNLYFDGNNNRLTVQSSQAALFSDVMISQSVTACKKTIENISIDKITGLM